MIFLLARGADATIASYTGGTPLQMATSRGLQDIVQVILQHQQYQQGVRLLQQQQLQQQQQPPRE